MSNDEEATLPVIPGIPEAGIHYLLSYWGDAFPGSARKILELIGLFCGELSFELAPRVTTPAEWGNAMPWRVPRSVRFVSPNSRPSPDREAIEWTLSGWQPYLAVPQIEQLNRKLDRRLRTDLGSVLRAPIIEGIRYSLLAVIIETCRLVVAGDLAAAERNREWFRLHLRGNYAIGLEPGDTLLVLCRGRQSHTTRAKEGARFFLVL